VSDSEQPILIDRDKELLDHVIEHINIDHVKYYETDEDGRIKIVVEGTFDDEEQAEAFLNGTDKEALDAYDRAMKGI
jgi:hypothetical protein